MSDETRFLTIIVPVLNEALALPPFLGALETALTKTDETVDTIFVDGGSEDDTPSLIRGRGFQLYESTRGRGNQIAEGLSHAVGEWVLILHADALIAPDALTKLGNRLKQSSDVRWGVLGHCYDDKGIGLRLTAWFNALRFRFLGLAYGDQGMFFDRALVEELGGFPRQPLMEDVELSMRLAPYPRIRLGSYLTVSARRWRRSGFWRYTFGNLRLTRRYVSRRKTGTPAEEAGAEAYREYYASTPNGKSE